MNIYDWWKQLRRRLRHKRRWLDLAVWTAVAAGIGGYTVWTDRPVSPQAGEAALAVASVPYKEPVWAAELRSKAGYREVRLDKIYVCGEENTIMGARKAEDIIAMHRQHPGWEGHIDEDGTFVFTEHIGDLSPECKTNAYIGVDRDGNLTLFNGPPQNDKAIQTFFQLNIKLLESSLPKSTIRQLQEGIRITDLEEYNSVLSTFSSYALEQTEKVMKPNL